MNDQPNVLLAELTECISGRGTGYVRGYLGASNVVGFAGDPDEQGRPTWKLYLVERQPKPANGTDRPSRGPQANGFRREGDRYRVPQESARARQDRVATEILERHGCVDGLDDELPF